VGRESCAVCHADEAALFANSHHDLAMQVADAATVLGDFDDATFAYNDITTTFSTRDGQYFVRTDGPDGTLQDYRVSYAFGVDPLQQYLIEFPDGRKQALSIAWDSRPREQGGQRWFHLYPDEGVNYEDVLHWTRFSQNWNQMCAECHSTDLKRNYDALADRYATTWSEIDVSCEACHGPGSGHVAWANRGEAAAAGDRMGLVVDLADREGAVWNIDPASGLATRSVPRASHTALETCARCHARRGVVSDDYQFGQPLMATHQPALLTDPLYFSDGQIRDEVYVYGSFLQSKMYQRGVTCTDCHNAHTLTVSGEGNSRCAGCHLPAKFDSPSHHHHEADSAGASCVACHMPTTTYMGVDARRDHSFRVPRPDLTRSVGSPNACASCHSDQSTEWAVAAVSRWYGPRPPHFGEVLDRARRAEPDAGAALVELARSPDTPAIVRATAVDALRGYPGAAAQGAIAVAAVSEEPLLRLASVGALDAVPPAERVVRLAPLLEDPVRTVRLEAARSLAAVRVGQLSAAQRVALDGALEEYRQAQQINSDRAEAHVNLGVLSAQRNELASAEVSFQAAIARNPFFVPAYVNLVEIYRIQAREEDAARVLTGALARTPDAADLHHAFGLVRVRQRRQPEALASLQRAAELAPEQARYGYVLGVALNSAGRTGDALATLRQVSERHPRDRDVLAALATISRDAGALEAALEYARALVSLDPGDPQARQLLAQLDAER
jgi:Flp pilus assembly protein TadD